MITKTEVQALTILLSRTPMSLPEQIFAAQLVNKLLEVAVDDPTPNSNTPDITGSPSADESAGKVDK